MKPVLDVTFPFKAFSVNKFQKTAKTLRRYTTPEGAEYQKNVNFLLPKHIDITFPFYHIEYAFYYKNLFNKAGEISSRTLDTDNAIKILQDVIFNKYGLTDKAVVSLTSRKLPDDIDKFRIIVYGLTKTDYLSTLDTTISFYV